MKKHRGPLTLIGMFFLMAFLMQYQNCTKVERANKHLKEKREK